MAKLFGESIPEYVVTQLQRREEILGADGLQGIRSERDLQYLTQKGAWIRMISGTDVEIFNQPEEFSNILSKNFILSGGVLKWNSNLNKFEIKSDNFSASTDEGKYKLSENLGIRPEPGITSFSISHKNRFGTIREATVDFVVWTREDLESSQVLFLRPGAQVVVEWGNSLYVDNDGEIVDIPVSENIREYFNNVRVDKIYEYINTFKKSTVGNYDGFLGLVTNFTWSYRQDGGYNCQLKIISRGAILESLTLFKPLKLDKIPKYIVSDANTSLLHYFLFLVRNNIETGKSILTVDDLEIYKTVSTSFITSGVSGGTVQKNETTEVQSNIKTLIKERSQDVNTNALIDDIKIYRFNAKSESGEVDFSYISLRTFLLLVNTSFINTGIPSVDFAPFYLGEDLSTETKDSLNLGDKVDYQKYKTFKEHFSLDPFIAILPTSPAFSDPLKDEVLEVIYKRTLERSYGYDPEYIKTDPVSIVPFQILPNAISLKIKENVESSTDDILNIHVNLGFVKEILDGFISKDENSPSKINVRDFVIAILDKISLALGGINSLDIHFDNDLQKYIIVDRDIVNEQLVKNKTARLNVAGLKTTVSDIQIQSKITSELSSMIAISNQVTKIDDVQADLPLLQWNKGTRNRFVSEVKKPTIEESVTGTGEVNPFFTALIPYEYTTEGFNSQLPVNPKKAEPEGNIILDFFKNIKEGYLELNNVKKGFFRRSQYKKEIFDRAKGEGNLVFKKLIQQSKNNKTKQISDQGLIPLELSITLDGISGMKIGQVFTLGTLDKPSNILPAVYNKYGFIITALNDEVDSAGKWKTVIKAQTFKLD